MVIISGATDIYVGLILTITTYKALQLLRVYGHAAIRTPADTAAHNP
jgi:predicted ABC-type sugar transport system permease subunit